MYRVLGSLLFVLIVVGLYFAANGNHDEAQSQDSAATATPARPATPVPGNKNFNF